MSDTVLMGVLALFVMLGTLGISSAYYAFRCDELRKQHARRVEQANAEVLASRQMVKKVEMQSRILDSTHVGRLIGKEEG